MGYLNPVFAALIHVSSELLFILNSARLLPSFVAETGLPGATLSDVPAAAAKGQA
jgi:Cd2+/Zn2+-exporting ATPase/Cu+-exporting ATPase